MGASQSAPAQPAGQPAVLVQAAPPVAVQIVPPIAHSLHHGDHLIFDPPNLVVGDLAEGKSIHIRLRRPPRGRAHVFFSAPSILFNKCMLRFDRRNWRVPQRLRLAGSPFLTPAQAQRTLEAQFTVSDTRGSPMHQKTVTYTVTRNQDSGAKCVGWGDPHYTMFDGRTFNFYHDGCHIFTEPKPGKQGLTVQAITRIPESNHNVAYNAAVAIRYYSTHYVLCSEAGLRRVSRHSEGIQVTAGAMDPNTKEQTFNFLMNDGSTITIKRYQVDNNKFFAHDVTLVVPSHRAGTVQGMCGELGPTASGGIPIDQSDQMVAQHVCRDDDNLFHCGFRGARCRYGRIANPEIHKKCRIPVLNDQVRIYEETIAIEPPSDGFAVLTDFLPYNGEAQITRSDVRLAEAVCPPDMTNKILGICQKSIHHPRAHSFVNNEHHIKECITDVCQMRDYGQVEVAKQSYYMSVHRYMESRLDDPACDMTARADLTAVYVDLGLGTSTCLSACNNHGACRPYGCRCDAGFTGQHCELSLSGWTF